MSPEQITAMIQALGYPVCVSIALFLALVVLFRKYIEAVSKLADATTDHAERIEVIAKASNEALSANTTSNRKLVEAIESRPAVACQAGELLRILGPQPAART